MIKKNKAVISLFSYVFYVLISIIVLALIISSTSKVLSKNQEIYNYNKMIENINSLDQTINKVATTRFSNRNIEIYNPDQLTIDCEHNKIHGSTPYSSNLKTEKTNINGITIYKKQDRAYFEKTISGYDLINLTCKDLTLKKGKNLLGVTYFDYNLSNSKVDIDITPIKNRNNNWYNSDWKYRKLIIINHNKVLGTLTNFPVLISITDKSLINRIKSDGSDIIFTIDNGNGKLYREIENYNNQTGSLVAWVNIPKLDNIEDYKIYMYYGNPDANELNDTETWDNSYVMVQHLNNLLDSTDNNINGTIVQSPVITTGKIDGDYYFDNNGSIDLGNNVKLSLSTALTLEAWVKTPSYDQFDSIAGKGTKYDSATDSYLMDIVDGKVRYFIYTTSYSSNKGITPIVDNKWHHVVMEYNGSTVNGYVDGNLDISFAKTGNLQTTSTDFYIGGLNTTYLFNGIIDEVRVSNTPRSLDWIKTEYNNQNSPSTFVTVGEQENR